MEPNNQLGGSTLFLVRVWGTEVGEGQMKCCGKVQHLVSGEAHAFGDWPELVDRLLEMLKRESTLGPTVIDQQ